MTTRHCAAAQCNSVTVQIDLSQHGLLLLHWLWSSYWNCIWNVSSTCFWYSCNYNNLPSSVPSGHLGCHPLKKIEKNYWQRKPEILFALHLNTRLHLQIAMDRPSVRGGVVGGRRQGVSVSWTVRDCANWIEWVWQPKPTGRVSQPGEREITQRAAAPCPKQNRSHVFSASVFTLNIN